MTLNVYQPLSQASE